MTRKPLPAAAISEGGEGTAAAAAQEPVSDPSSPGGGSAAAPAATTAATAAASAASIEECLLAVSKDRRYVDECRQLLVRILLSSRRWFLPSNSSGSSTGNSDVRLEQRVESIASLLSSALFAATALRQRRRREEGDGQTRGDTTAAASSSSTPGMDACGLSYNDESKYRLRAMGASLLTAVAVYAIQQLSSSLDDEEGEQGSRTTAAPATTTATALHGAEELRGQRRRQFFEEQRRAMRERAAAAATESGGAASSSTESSAARSGRPSKSSGVNRAAATGDNDALLPPPSTSSPRRRRLRRLARCLLGLLAPGLGSSDADGGPHSLLRLSPPPSVDGGNNDNNLATAAGTGNSTTRMNLSTWLIRLHLALYCINGTYPSWMHRIFGLKMIRRNTRTQQEIVHNGEEKAGGGDNNNGGSSRLVPRPSSNVRVVGLLILVQAVGVAVPAVAQYAIRLLVDRMYCSSGRRVSGEGNASDDASFAPPPAFRIFDDCLNIDNKTRAADHETAGSSSSDDAAASSRRSSCCVICRRSPYDHPSCPISCGHVFCWSCLQRWIASSPECPYCRSPCRPQDVLPLCDYF